MMKNTWSGMFGKQFFTSKGTICSILIQKEKIGMLIDLKEGGCANMRSRDDNGNTLVKLDARKDLSVDIRELNPC